MRALRAEFALAPPVDLVWTSQNYHDFHNIKDLDVVDFDKAVFGGPQARRGVHRARSLGRGRLRRSATPSTLHRIDQQAVKKEVESAGFKFAGESNALRNKDDPHTAKVFDASIRGHTDQFILKFLKPK